MNYRKVIENQILELEARQKRLEGKTVAIEDYLKISATIGQLAVIASKLPVQRPDA